MSTVTSTLPVVGAPARAATASPSDPADFEAEYESALAALPDAQTADAHATDTQATDAHATDAQAPDAQATEGGDYAPVPGGAAPAATPVEAGAVLQAGIPIDPGAAAPALIASAVAGALEGTVDTPDLLAAAQPAPEDDATVDLPGDDPLPGGEASDAVPSASPPAVVVAAPTAVPDAAITAAVAAATTAAIASAPAETSPSVPAGAAAPAPVAPVAAGSVRVLDGDAVAAAPVTPPLTQPETAAPGAAAPLGTAASPVSASAPAMGGGATAAAGVPGSESGAPAASATTVDAAGAVLPPVVTGATAGAAPTTAEASPAPRVDVASLAAQVARPLHALRSAGDGTHVLTISVTPDDLGPVQVRAHVSGESLRIELIAPTDQARDALKSILGDLRRDLSFGGGQASLDLSSGNEPSGRDAAPGDSGGRSAARDAAAPAVIDPRRPLRTDSVLDVFA